MRYEEFQTVRLTADITQRWHNIDLTIAQERQWSAGSIGTIVHVHDDGKAFEVEFDDGTATVRHDQLEPVDDDSDQDLLARSPNDRAAFEDAIARLDGGEGVEVKFDDL